MWMETKRYLLFVQSLIEIEIGIMRIFKIKGRLRVYSLWNQKRLVVQGIEQPQPKIRTGVKNLVVMKQNVPEQNLQATG